MKIPGSFQRTAIAVALCSQAAFSFATPPVNIPPVMFNPAGTGATGAIQLGMLDWMPNNALSVKGNPTGGLALGSIVHLLAQGRLGVIIDSNGMPNLVPSGSEITFVAGFAEKVNTFESTSTGATAAFLFDGTSQLPNFFEMWVSSPADSNPLTGTGYNNTKRILLGVVTDASGNYSGGAPLTDLDQFGANDYLGILTITGSGSTQLAGNIISADPDYFPGLTQAQIDNMKVFFNTSTVTPYKQTNPSMTFIGNGAGALGNEPQAIVNANIGTINGGLQFTTDLNFELQADANQVFTPGAAVPETCRVTYGGNDRNGNVDPAKFGSACSSNPDKTQNCYTFGGQVGAPTGNPNLGGPFGEHTHHQTLGPAGDFVFRAGTHSAPKETRITAIACKDPGAIQPAAANAGFKQIDFEGTGSFRTLDAVAIQYLKDHGAPSDIATDSTNTTGGSRVYYFRVDMVDTGEPGNGFVNTPKAKKQCLNFFNADQNNPLATPDPNFLTSSTPPGYVDDPTYCADLYQLLICPTADRCGDPDSPNPGIAPMYAVRAYLTGGNIQMHQVIK